MPTTDTADAIQRAYDRYADGRDELRRLAPCPKCCPPKHPCSPGEYICGCDIRVCGKCHGDGFWIDWDSEEGDE